MIKKLGIVIILILGVFGGKYGYRYAMRSMIFHEVQPVSLKNCELKRYGLGYDEGYLVCDNFVKNTQVVYSYGIDGRDALGCEVSSKLKVPVHQYDCFNTKKPACPGGKPVFHEECVGPVSEKDKDGRVFDTIANQIQKNGDSGKTVFLKIDVEGAEWDSLAATPDEVLEHADQIVMEFHKKHDRYEYVKLLQKLKKNFYVVHLHFNNHACTHGQDAPMPAWAFQVLLVNKKIGVLDEGKKPVLPNPLDQKDNPKYEDCQKL